jgi:GT2 family glycosyltransferase
VTPALSVVVASHDRPLRLRWLLNALEEQSLAREAWEVVVAHDSGAETAALLATHPLAAAGTLRTLAFGRGAGPAEKRNAAWRAARAGVVVFTDDDCRPPAEWLGHVLAAVRAHPGAIVQGATRPDPDELALVAVAGWRSQQIDPPVPWAQTCNIAFPRAALEAVGGFDATLPDAAGEDTDLALRARAAGVPYAGAPAMLTYHCIEVPGLRARLRDTQRWRHLPGVVARHPRLRRGFPLRVFWKQRHALLGPALLGAGLAARQPRRAWALALVLPWARLAAPSYGPGARGRLRAVAELPANALVDAAEVAALARGSVAHRTLLL